MLLVEVGVDQLVVGRVDDGGPVRCREHVRGAVHHQRAQRDGLRAQAQSFPLAQAACGCVQVPAEQHQSFWGCLCTSCRLLELTSLKHVGRHSPPLGAA